MSAPVLNRGQVFAHVPYPLFRGRYSLFLDEALQPEIYLSAGDLEESSAGEAAELARRLRGADLACTIHAPFLDLNPGALDRGVRLLTLERCRATLGMAALFGARAVVFHTGYDRWRYDWETEPWLRASLDTWRQVAAEARRAAPGTRLLFENVFETSPGSLVKLLEALDEPLAGACFDTGHFLLFGEERLEDWLAAISPWLGELHIHDNDGCRDLHRPPGTGRFPFDRLFAALDPKVSGRLLVTLEAHSERDLRTSLAWLNETFHPAAAGEGP